MNRFYDKVLVFSLIALVVLSCFPHLVTLVKADTYNQIPLWINVMEGAPATGDEINNIEKRIDEIFKQNGLNWRVTSVILDENYPDPDKTNDDPGDVREGAEENGLYNKGKSETKNLGGFKIFVVNRILNGTGHDVGYLGGSRQSSHTAVVASNYTDVDEGTIWAHELGHLLGLDHENPDGSDRPEGHLMHPFWPQNAGANLTDADKATMNATKIEQGLGLPTVTPDQNGTHYDMYRYILEDLYGDSLYDFTDLQELYFGFYKLDSTENLYVTTYLRGIIPLGAGITYQLAFDADNDPTTGGEFMGWLGIDYLIVFNVIIDSVPPKATLYSYPSMIPIVLLDSRVDTQYQFICPRNPPKIPSIPLSNKIVIRLSLSELGSLGLFINVGAVIESSDGLGSDSLEIKPLNTAPLERPSLKIQPGPNASVGSNMTAKGWRFKLSEPGDNVTVKFAQIPVARTNITPDLTFEITFIVPDLPLGDYMVDAISESNEVAVCMFTIVAEASIEYECSGQFEPQPEPFNMRSNGRFTAFIEIAAAGYTVADINASTMLLHIFGEVTGVEPSSFPIIGDYDSDGIPDLMVTFNREEIATLILSRGIIFGNVDLTIKGRFLDGKYFEGTATVKISDLYGDINCDGAVSLQDLVMLAKAYGSSMDDPGWNDNANFAAPWDTIGLSDLVILAQHYGEHYP